MQREDGGSGERSYSEKSPFVRLLETRGRVRILDVFLRKHYTELGATDVADLADVSPSTFHRNISELKDLDIVRETDSVSGVTQYKLNEDSPIAQTLGKARAELLEYSKTVMRETDSSGLPDLEEAISAQNRRSKRGPNDDKKPTHEAIAGAVEVPN